MLTQIKHIQASKAAALLELEKRRKTEKQLTSELQDEIQKILEETNEGLDALGNEDVASYFFVVHGTCTCRTMYMVDSYYNRKWQL
jgi:hypothetical protein